MKTLPSMTEDELRRGQDESTEAGFGAMQTAQGPLPLKAMDVQTQIEGLLAQVELTQTFVNTHDEHLEATYIFPLPDRAAVTRFRLEVAGRVIEGALKERGDARREYRQAIDAGHRAAITEEERPGVFTMCVGNLPPGESATVRLSMAGPLAFSDGEATFRFPLVVAPRYIPGMSLPGSSVGSGTASDTDAVPDASRITPPVLLPGFPNPVQLSLCVEFTPSSMVPYDVRSSLHTVVQEEQGAMRRLRLEPGERLNRDFILRFRLAEEKVRTSLTLHPDAGAEEGTFLLTLVPPRLPTASRPRDIVFALDRSGSMSGWKMVAARRAVGRMVETLTDDDRFTILAFDHTIETPKTFDGDALMQANHSRRFQAIEFLNKVDAQGGTEMFGPLSRAVQLLGKNSAEREHVLVLITDGQIGNEDQLLRTIGEVGKDIRIFTLGIDRAVNAGFLRRLSDLGGGSSELVETEERLDAVMDKVHRQIGTPVLTDVHLEAQGLTIDTKSIAPKKLPDLFVGSPIQILGRYRGAPEGSITIQGQDSAGRPISLTSVAKREERLALGSVWAKARIRDLEDGYAINRDPRLEKELVALSLQFNVLCRFTSFVAVDLAEKVNEGGKGHTITQPVEQPEGWEDQRRMKRKAALSVPMSSPPPACAAEAPQRAIVPPASIPSLMRAEADFDDDCAAESADTLLPAQDQPLASKRTPRTHRAKPSKRAKKAPASRSQPAAKKGNWSRDQEARKAGPSPKAGSGLWSSLKEFFGFGGDSSESNEPDSPRKTLQEMRDKMVALETDEASHRLWVLRDIRSPLQRFLERAKDDSINHPTIRQLETLSARLSALLASTQPPEAEVGALWTELQSALEACLKAGESTWTASEKDESFWK